MRQALSARYEAGSLSRSKIFAACKTCMQPRQQAHEEIRGAHFIAVKHATMMWLSTTAVKDAWRGVSGRLWQVAYRASALAAAITDGKACRLCSCSMGSLQGSAWLHHAWVLQMLAEPTCCSSGRWTGLQAASAAAAASARGCR